MISLILCIIPTLWEIWDDRNGETKKDKTRDFLIAVIMYSVIALANWWIFETHPLKSLALTFAFRLLVFDYAIAYVLIKRGVIVGNWFSYTGKTARWDKLIARVNPWLRFAARVVLFAAVLWWLYSAPQIQSA